MRSRRALIWGALLLALAIGAGIWLWRSARPDPHTLAGALEIATRDITGALTPEDRRGSYGLDAIFNRFVPPTIPVAERRALLESAGFTCEAGALACTRFAPGSSAACTYRWVYHTRLQNRQVWNYGGVADTGYLSVSC